MKIYPAVGVEPVKDAGGKGVPSGGLYIGTTSDVPVHSSGWIWWNSIEPETADWHWVRVHSDDAPNNAVVNVTLTAGQHTILWAHRESENFLDAFVITDKID